MATEYKLSYTAAEINERLLKVAKLSEDTEKLTADTTKLTTDAEKLATDMQNKAEVVELTTAEYEALEETNANTLYMLTDGEEDAVVQYVEQTLTDEQKAQARANIGITGTGADGYIPVRGTDYWTDADKAEIKSYVDEAILGGAW